jgi:hypothetical protein
VLDIGSLKGQQLAEGWSLNYWEPLKKYLSAVLF